MLDSSLSDDKLISSLSEDKTMTEMFLFPLGTESSGEDVRRGDVKPLSTGDSGDLAELNPSNVVSPPGPISSEEFVGSN